MASRQEEKEARRQERLERERKEAAAAARRKRLQLVGGVVLGVAAIAVVALAVVARRRRRRQRRDGTRQGADSSDAGATRSCRRRQTSDYEAAAKAAGCTLSNPAYEGATHEHKDFKASRLQDEPADLGQPQP